MTFPMTSSPIAVRRLVAAVALALAAMGASTQTPGTAASAPPLAPGPAAAKSGPGPGASAPTGERVGGTVPRATRRFVETAAQDGVAEVALGQLAKQRGQSDKVKAFGEQMVTDHTKAADELKAVATSKGLNVPGEPAAKHRRVIDRLGKLSGHRFDREYMKLMVSDHKKAVGLFSRQAQAGKDPGLRAFAASTLPTLEHHLKMAQEGLAGVKGAETH